MQRRSFLGLLAALAVGRRLNPAPSPTVMMFQRARRWERDEIARLFGVPAHLIGDAPHYIVTPQGLR